MARYSAPNKPKKDTCENTTGSLESHNSVCMTTVLAADVTADGERKQRGSVQVTVTMYPPACIWSVPAECDVDFQGDGSSCGYNTLQYTIVTSSVVGASTSNQIHWIR